MEPDADDVAAIPRENVRIPIAEFAAVWRQAERRYQDDVQRGVVDWYVYGVAATCRWMAGAGWRLGSNEPMARAPATERAIRPQPETIEGEVLDAARLLAHGRPEWPGWAEAIVNTFGWAWGGSGVQPLAGPDVDTPGSVSRSCGQ